MPPSHFLLSQKKVLTRMQQKQVTKKAAVARKVNGSRGVTIFNLQAVDDIKYKYNIIFYDVIL